MIKILYGRGITDHWSKCKCSSVYMCKYLVRAKVLCVSFLGKAKETTLKNVFFFSIELSAVKVVHFSSMKFKRLYLSEGLIIAKRRRQHPRHVLQRTSKSSSISVGSVSSGFLQKIKCNVLSRYVFRYSSKTLPTSACCVTFRMFCRRYFRI